MRSAGVLSIATIVFLSAACSRYAEKRAAAEPAQAGVERAAPAHAGPAPYRVEPEAIERFIRFQERMLPLQARMLADLARADRADGGTATVAAIRRHAEAEEAARRDVGLSERDVEQLESIVTDVISRRAAAAVDDSEATLREMEALAARLPVEQRTEFEATLGPLRRQVDQSRALAAERARHGSENVDRVLAREAELTEHWNRAIAVFAGVSQERVRSPSDGAASSGGR
ncbi:MAG TPA: hypothetical protein VE549_00570 [Myxococcaceae bacterium]|nr:hypothetical protein [Myxococcaceae bacterium]